jgi:CheY-like chemotaxis protein
MDFNLPGMNGVQALKRLQKTEETKDILVVAVTSNTMPKDVKRA